MLFIEFDNVLEVADSGFVESGKESWDADVFKVPDCFVSEKGELP